MNDRGQSDQGGRVMVRGGNGEGGEGRRGKEMRGEGRELCRKAGIGSGREKEGRCRVCCELLPSLV